MDLNWPEKLPDLFPQSSSYRLTKAGPPIPRLVVTPEIAEELAKQVSVHLFGDRRRLRPQVLEQSGLFNSLHLRDDQGWTEFVLRFFPYSVHAASPAWGKFARQLLEFESGRWKTWETNVASEAGGGQLKRLVFSAGPWEQSTLPRVLSLHLQHATVPGLVRRYLPWPSLRDAALRPEQIRTLIQSFYATDLHRVIPKGRELPVDDAYRLIAENHPSLGPQHLLTNGYRMVPTRWRSFWIRGPEINLEHWVE
jgi:hypothetical protein